MVISGYTSKCWISHVIGGDVVGDDESPAYLEGIGLGKAAHPRLLWVEDYILSAVLLCHFLKSGVPHQNLS